MLRVLFNSQSAKSMINRVLCSEEITFTLKIKESARLDFEGFMQQIELYSTKLNHSSSMIKARPQVRQSNVPKASENGLLLLQMESF